MEKEKMLSYSKFYKDALLLNCIPFWEKNSLDYNNGGYFTCLDRQGRIYDTDKFAWLQGRQAWTFSMLYNQVEPKDKWLEIAGLGIDFLRKFGRDSEGNFYFSFTEQGSPLIQPYNIFSDCFAAMAFAQYGKGKKDIQILELAVITFNNILSRRNDPKGIYNKNVPEARPMKNFALPMILSNLCLELEWLLPKEQVEETLDLCISEVMGDFLDKNSLLIYENRNLDGTFSNSFEGRTINPGHGIEAMWFMMDIAVRRKDQALLLQAVEVTLNLLDYGWDNEFDGIFYFLDSQGKPPLSLEWDQKLWWVHLESLVAVIKGFQLTGDKRLWEWFEKIHNYSWEHFSDPENGEWFGYLNRRGDLLLDLKGGKWKGCFHVPRALYQVWSTLDRCVQT